MFEDKSYNKLFYKAGIKGSGAKNDVFRVFLALAICWLPIAIYTIFTGSFWTGEVSSSFISDFDFQARLLIAMPILILADRSVSLRLSLIINQLTNCGIIGKEINEKYIEIIRSNIRFLKSGWTDIVLLVLSYVQVLSILSYESTSTSILTWQVIDSGGESIINLAGYWGALIGVPFVLYLVFRWLLRIFVWGVILFKISRLDINLFPFHPDLSGGLGFLGYSTRYFSPIALAFSVIVAGNAADFMLIEGVHLIDLKYFLFGYIVFITFLFTFPMLFFTQKMLDSRERSIYENYDYTNGIYRELNKKIAKRYDEVNQDDLKLPDFSATSNLSQLVENALKMKSVPFTIKDNISLWIMTVLPFIGLVFIEFPMNDILLKAVSLLL